MGWWENIKQVIRAFLPQPVREILDKGLLRALGLLVSAVVIFPVVVALLGGFWLGQLGSMEFAPAKAMHTYLVSIIHDGIETEKVAAASHERLDYLQAFEYELKPRAVSLRELHLSLLHRQRAAIHIRNIEPISRDEKCILPEDAGQIRLVTVFLGDLPLGTLDRRSHDPISIDKKWWDANEGHAQSERLIFRLTDEMQTRMPCALVRIEGSIRVFKNLERLEKRTK